MENTKKIAIIHTTPLTIPSIGVLIKERLENVILYNFVDDSILPEMNAFRGATAAIKYRVHSMLTMAATTKPDAILCACSSIGGVIEEGRELLSIPILRIDEPMAAMAIEKGKKIGVAATLHSTIEPTKELLYRKAKEAGKEIEVESKVIENVSNLLSEGKEAEYDFAVSKELMELLDRNDSVILAQASMARVIKGMGQVFQKRLLTSPVSGVENLCNLIKGG